MPAISRADDLDVRAERSDPKYPIAVAVAVDGEAIYVVDLDLPGVWRIQGDQRELFVRGSKLLRGPLNRPRCVAVHPGGGILVGDSATREVYHVASRDAQPQPLSNSKVGIAMALAISPDGQTLYVGDAEKRSVLRFPLEGGQPELVVQINARGLAFDTEGSLWAVTPDDAAVHRIDVDAKNSTAVVTGRPYQYPNGLTWMGSYGLVTDGYGRSIWQFTPDGQTQLWWEGSPLLGPVGITGDETSVWVADPKKLQIFQFDRESKDFKPRL